MTRGEDLQPLRIAVGGGRGFIGGAVARALAQLGHDVQVFGREGAPATRSDVLVWAAGGREADLAANRAVHVDAAKKAIDRMSARAVLYLSTAEVYGGAPLPFREDGPIDPRTPYAIAKREGETSLAGPTTIVLRPGVVYGPRQAPRMLIPRLVAALRAGQPIPLTSGEQTRDFLFIDDLVELAVRCVGDAGGSSRAAPAGTYNAGTGVETSIKDVCRRVAGARGDLLRFGAQPPRPDEQMRYVLDPSHAEAALGWRAQVALADGIARTLAGH